MKALLIETYSHWDTFRVAIDLFKFSGLDVDTVKNFDDISKVFFSDIDVVYINTIYGRQMFRYTRIIRDIKKHGKKIIVGIHDPEIFYYDRINQKDMKIINKFLVENYHEVYKFPKALIKLYIGILRRLARKIRKCVDGIVVFGDYIPCFIKKCVKLPTRLTIPDVFDIRKEEIVKVDKTVFVVTGSVLMSVRRYLELLDTFEKTSRKDIRLVLLGKMKSSVVRNRVENSRKLKEIVEYYDEYVPEDLFREKLLQSHFSIIINKWIPPYGVYKATGSYHDAISHGVPIILPEKFRAPENISGIYKYKDFKELKDLVEALSDYVKHEKYDEILKDFSDFAATFSIEKISGRFSQFLEGLF